MLTFEQAFLKAELACTKAETAYAQAKKILRGKSAYDYKPFCKIRREVDYLQSVYFCEVDKLGAMQNYMLKIDFDGWRATNPYLDLGEARIWDL